MSLAATRSLRERIRQGRTLGVSWLSIGSASLAELAARERPDAIVLDLQHGTWDRQTLEAAIGLCGGVPVIARTQDGSASSIGTVLDAGAAGIIVPLVEYAEQAAAAVSAARYPPHGTRSGGGVRPLSGDFASYVTNANRTTFVSVMVETARGVANAAPIAATQGIDLVFIGTGDLALSLGTFPQFGPRHAEACAAVRAACRRAGTPCGIFTASSDAAAARAGEGFDLVVTATDIGIVADGFASARRRFEGRPATSSHPAPERTRAMPNSTLADLAHALALGAVEVVDLTQTLSPSTPVIQLPPPMAPSAAFSIEQISRYDESGPAWYWNNISMGEHTGTHFDAPVHWVTGRDFPDGATDTLAPSRFVAPACVIDCSAKVRGDEGFVLEPEHVEAWEAEHGRIPAGSWVLMRTDWSKRTGADFINMKENGPVSPGPSPAAVRLLVERDINGWGVEAVGTDAGLAFGFDPPFPAHNLMHGSKKLGLASLTNLDRLPPTGAILIAAPLKIEQGSGSPVRVLALVQTDARS